jgi:sugar (pentulose or hexulose) kinase
MNHKKVYLAVDLGAGSGRVLAGEFDGTRIELHELNRFENTPIPLPSGWHWNITSLYQNILEGLKLASEQYGEHICSIGIDTWGVDYALFDKDGRMLGMPYQYRDPRTDGMMEVAYQKVPKEAIFEGTGNQFMFFNTIFQLLSEIETKNPAIDSAEDMLFIPDLLGFWLTGQKTQERSFASTTQLYNPKTKDWNYDLIEKLGIPKKLFKTISDAGDTLGELTPRIQTKTGLGNVKVITVGGHDTASAVAAVPSQCKTPAFLSSGTWSLIGLELDEPVITKESYEDALTNEVAVGGKIRFQKNICGLWLIQESKRFWHEQGYDIPYAKMASLASEAAPFRSFINPDDPRFIETDNIPKKIQAFCHEHGQPIPETPGQIIRCIYESLALRYSQAWELLMKYVDEKPTTLHIVGGGCQDKLLNQFAANAIGVRVAACPVEATGLGNILAQMLADGVIADLKEGREIILNSSLVETFDPTDQVAWREARARFSKISH